MSGKHSYPCGICGEVAERHHVYEPLKPCDKCGKYLIPNAGTECLMCLGWDGADDVLLPVEPRQEVPR